MTGYLAGKAQNRGHSLLSFSSTAILHWPNGSEFHKPYASSCKLQNLACSNYEVLWPQRKKSGLTSLVEKLDEQESEVVVGRTLFQSRLQDEHGLPEVLVIRRRRRRRWRRRPHLPQQLSCQDDVKIVRTKLRRREGADEFDRLDVESAKLVDDRRPVVVGGVEVKAAQPSKLMPTDAFVNVIQLKWTTRITICNIDTIGITIG